MRVDVVDGAGLVVHRDGDGAVGAAWREPDGRLAFRVTNFLVEGVRASGVEILPPWPARAGARAPR